MYSIIMLLNLTIHVEDNVMVPESIRKIKRPANTIVQATKNPNVYMVIKRIGCKYVEGRRIPINGSVIGHIIDGKYVEKQEPGKKRISTREIHLLRYGSVAFADSVGESLYDSLKKNFHPKDAENIYCLALLRAAFGDIKDYQIQDRYEKSWACRILPGCAVSRNSVSKLLSDLGKSYDLLVSFMKQRIKEAVGEETRILIDGMLKNDSSKVDSFSGFSYKGRIKGTKDMSILAAVDAKRKEPLAIKIYPGNLPDAANIADFIEEFSIEGGLEISDKGIPLEKAKVQFSDGKVGFLHPVRRNSKKQEKLGLFKTLSPLKTEEGTLLASKAKDDRDGYFYYLFRDIPRARKEESDYVLHGSKKGNFDSTGYEEKSKTFGTICFVSNMDLDTKDVYEYYKTRWEIELIFRTYKGILDMNTTREHDNYTTIGSEFVNYLSTIMACRMKNRITEEGLFGSFTFRDVMERLNDCIKTSEDENGDDWKLCSLSKKDRELLDKLGL